MRRNGHTAWEDDDVRQQIAQFACEVSALRLLNLRQLTRQLKGLPPGPESSIVKVVTTEINLGINTFAIELLGAYSQIELDAPFAVAEGRWLYRMLASRGLTIAGGIGEIQRNIIGERVLGLQASSAIKRNRSSKASACSMGLRGTRESRTLTESLGPRLSKRP